MGEGKELRNKAKDRIKMLNGPTKSYSQAARQLAFAVHHPCVDATEVRLVKQYVQDSYNSWAHQLYDKAFLNWGLWDKNLQQEYLDLCFDFSALCPWQDINSQLITYFLIRPLIQNNFFKKRILDIGCANGLGLKVCSELLKTEYALGVDLVNKLVSNAQNNFYQQDKINYIQSDSERLPLADESFDIITNLESSHLYPDPISFFSEVARVLAPSGFFCYADIHIADKQQAEKLEHFIHSSKNLKIIRKQNITKLVQASIFQRLIVRESSFIQHAYYINGQDEARVATELPSLAFAMGLAFLPWWKIWFKTPSLRPVAKMARKDKNWGKKYFFYYLIQKVD